MPSPKTAGAPSRVPSAQAVGVGGIALEPVTDIVVMGQDALNPGLGHASFQMTTHAWNFDKIPRLSQQVRPMLKTSEPQRKTPSLKAVLRAVASSTAVETGRSVVELEQKLQQPRGRFAHIKLAR